MAKPQKISYNDWLMKRTGLLIVYAWVMLAVGFFVLTAWDPTYLNASEDYVSILAIIGGPALLIITKIIETWNQEKQNQIGDYEAQAQHERAMDEIRVKHEADMERNPNCNTPVDPHPSSGGRITQVERQLEKAIKDIEKLKGGK